MFYIKCNFSSSLISNTSENTDVSRKTDREIRNPGTKSTVSFSEPHAVGTPPAMYQQQA